MIFPHHENEIAQSEAWQGGLFARYFLHNGFVTINKEKMSKSLGNFFALKDIFLKFTPRSVRYYILSEHYRSPLDFSDEALREAGRALDRIDEAGNLLVFFLKGESLQALNIEARGGPLSRKVFECLSQDFHTPSALAGLQTWAASVFETFKSRSLIPERAKEDLADTAFAMETRLGIPFRQARAYPREAWALVEQREASRGAKNFAQADQLRRRLQEEFGLAVEDTPYGPKPK